MEKQIKPVTNTVAITDGADALRYQIYRQSRAGTFMAEYKTNSAAEALDAFLRQSPGFDSGELLIWNHREGCVSALVVWCTEQTAFGFPVHHRTNEFLEPFLGVIDRQLQKREELRVILTREIRASLVA